MERSVAVFFILVHHKHNIVLSIMGYYIRILGIQDPDINVQELINALSFNGLTANLEVDKNEQTDKWTMLDVTNNKGEVLARIERNPVINGELGREEIDEFIEEIQNEKPASSVKWLGKYLKKIKVIYAFQMLTAGFDDGNFEILSSIKNKIWNITGGILQADNEGFSNEDGYHILWQFADSVTGKWSCAVLDIFGNWKKFTMDLGDITQRKEFKNGKVPKNAIRL